jgi:hypothetical protein
VPESSDSPFNVNGSSVRPFASVLSANVVIWSHSLQLLIVFSLGMLLVNFLQFA